MSSSNMKYFLGVLAAGAVLGALAFFGASPFIKTVEYVTGFGSSSGSTFNTAKFAGIVVGLANPGANATSSSVYNGDASARYVSAWRIGCQGMGTSKTAYTGAGLANLLLTIGTTTTSAPAVIPSSLVVANAITISTSTASFASSTALVNGGLNAVWPSATYMTFWFNATNTAACTVGVDYFNA